MASSFIFCSQDSYTDFGIIIERKNRPLFPAKRVDKVAVYGKSGSVNLDESNIYEDIVIDCECVCDTANFVQKRERVREIASWLSESGNLIFSDEPHLHYIAEVISQLDFEDIATCGKFTISFLCNPFAYSDLKKIAVTNKVNTIEYNGTAPSPCNIILKTGVKAVTKIQITTIKKG